VGADFSEKVKGTFKRHLDAAGESLRTDTLFTQKPTGISRTFRAEVIDGVRLEVGQKLSVRCAEGSLVAMNVMTPMAACADPPEPLLNSINNSGGVAIGTVLASHAMAGVVEITCE
jgi:hypothetical protein